MDNRNRDGEQLLTQQNLETWAHQSQDLSKAALAREVLKLRNRIMIMDMFPPPDSSTQKVEGLDVHTLERKRTYNPWQEELKVGDAWYVDTTLGTVKMTDEDKWVYDRLTDEDLKGKMLARLWYAQNDVPAPHDPQQPPTPFVSEKGSWPKWRGKEFGSTFMLALFFGACTWLVKENLFLAVFTGTFGLIALSSAIKSWVGK